MAIPKIKEQDIIAALKMCIRDRRSTGTILTLELEEKQKETPDSKPVFLFYPSGSESFSLSPPPSKCFPVFPVPRSRL